MTKSNDFLPINSSYDYLIANSFLHDFSITQALSAAFNIQLIDLLLSQQSLTVKELVFKTSADTQGLQYLLGILVAGNIVKKNGNNVSLSLEFQRALSYRDFIEAQIAFANLVAGDIVKFFPLLLESSEKFMSEAALFELFDYSRAIEFSEDNLAFTRRWMHFTTALTRYEGKVCGSHHDFSHYQTMMDIGGNSGEFVFQLCRQFPNLHATVVDLPLVCDIGRGHVDKHPQGSHRAVSTRINFCKANALVDTLPGGYDLISFKSILHDWPEPAVRQFIRNSVSSLRPGGKLLIFERDLIDPAANNTAFFLLPMLLFFRSFRNPCLYEQILKEEGFVDIQIDYLQLETPFFLLTAVKGDSLE